MSLGAVLICKEYSESYANAFSKRGFIPHFLQVLESRLVNEHILNQTIQAGPETKYGAVIITSSRAANAWVNGIRDVLSKSSESVAKWNKVPFYVVGKATETALRASDELLSSPLEILGAETTGTGEKLAQFVVETYGTGNKLDEGRRAEILYLTGDKNRETIPEILSKAGLQYQKMQVYETGVVADLSTKLAAALLEVQTDSHAKPLNKTWIALFSPSTASYVLDAARSADRNVTFVLAAIGPTTEEYLKTNGYEVPATSTKPDAESLAEAIHSVLQRQAFPEP